MINTENKNQPINPEEAVQEMKIGLHKLSSEKC
jgi:hypothetical protein